MMAAIGQYLRFGGVGLAATASHALLFALLIEALGWPALAANLAAFAGALLVSFAGHHCWTFGAGRAHRRRDSVR
jgi:putative flippase GtrA